MIEYYVEVRGADGIWKPSVKSESIKIARRTKSELAELGHDKVRIVQVTTSCVREEVK